MNALNHWKIRPHVNSLTSVVLAQLVEKKAEKDKWKKALNQWGLSMLFVVVATFVYLYYFKVRTASYMANPLTLLFDDEMVWVCIVYLILSSFQMIWMKKKYKKADDDYEAIRKDFIDRNEEWWSDEEQWEMRHVVFEFMKKEYNINIYHK
jgi:cobalamin biosynthesis protein CobD/CbiB